MLSTDHIPLMLSSTQMLGHIVLADYSTTLANYSSVCFMRHDVTSDVLYNIYIIYIIVQSLSHFRSKCFLKKFMK
jgi:hypothetical protein